MTRSSRAPATPPLPRPGTLVEIRYRRIGKATEVYPHLVLEATPEVIVSFQPRTSIGKPLVVEGLTILEPRSPVIWFTFPGKWHDVGIFHRTNGASTGLYGNILTPVEIVERRRWLTTDLCLDVWAPRWGPVQLLDEDELDAAEKAGQIRERDAARARAEARTLVAACHAGTWPPPVVAEWSLVRALETFRGMGA